MTHVRLAINLALAAVAMCGLAPLAHAQGYPPREAASHMRVPVGLEVQLFAAEPLVRQPVAIEFDDRGRLWVIQYLQYPNPAGLKRGKVDRYSRTTVRPRARAAAARAARGRPDHDSGRHRRRRPGRSRQGFCRRAEPGQRPWPLATAACSCCRCPTCCSIPIAIGDDVPDGDPEVLLTGFGMEDAHSRGQLAHLGPRRLAVRLPGEHGDGQHSRHRVSAGRLALSSAHAPLRAVLRRRRQFVGPRFRRAWQPALLDQLRRLRHAARRAGRLLLEAVRQARRAAQSATPTATSITCRTRTSAAATSPSAASSIRATRLPASFAASTSPPICWAMPSTGTSCSRAARRFGRATAATCCWPNDTWFAPSDVTVGPDGAVYVGDWYDRRTAHPDPDADWDRSNGRIYRIKRRRARRGPSRGNFRSLSSDAARRRCWRGKNDWYVRKARRVAGRSARSGNDLAAADAGGRKRRRPPGAGSLVGAVRQRRLERGVRRTLLEHRNADVRWWTVRLLGDESRVSSPNAARLAELAARRSQRRRAQPVGLHGQAAAERSGAADHRAVGSRAAKTQAIRTCRC